MNGQVEETVRDVLAERADGIVPPAGWETRVRKAGRQRRRRRRLAVAAWAAAAVLVVGFAANGGLASYVGLPIGPAGGQSADPRVPRTAPAELPVGRAPEIAYAIGAGNAPPGDTVMLPSGRWKPGGYVTALERAGDGIVAVAGSHGGGAQDLLVYRAPDGRTRTLDRGLFYGVAVSADGQQVAWATSADGDGPTKLTLAELPSGEVLASTTVPKPGPNPQVAAFVGDKVLLDYDLVPAEHPYARAWDPRSGEIAPLLGPTYEGTGGQVRSIDPARDTVILLDGESCVRSISLADPAQPERWKVCERDIGGGTLSPDGRRLVGTVNDPDSPWDAVWIRDAKTGRLLAQRAFEDAEVSVVGWESADSVLVGYTTVGSDRPRVTYGDELLRCPVDLRDCRRARLPGDNGVSALLSDQGPWTRFAQGS